jgi:hypothetical protein
MAGDLNCACEDSSHLKYFDHSTSESCFDPDPREDSGVLAGSAAGGRVEHLVPKCVEIATTFSGQRFIDQGNAELPKIGRGRK